MPWPVSLKSRLSLPLIAALSDAYEVRGAERGGTEVRMSFLALRDHDPVDDDPIDETAWQPPDFTPPEAP